ncbi:histidine phosphatase family protein [Hoeflea poritis]|uniref:Phosphoglycerate mutase family protein n=1 Tax=Hoeflea poritis TaxID=2993659 RepID=A0ABT4VKZ6_9HYPH|nr:histidine phosphatase family protein [Hoeflea poritis]MDA4844830.1 phosphoglycerate mutase family protein [Hoeflea poritis]
MALSLPPLYVVRHGVTDWNIEGRFQGARDIPLNATGRRQAADNGRALQALIGEHTDKYDFVSSPLNRTRATMELLRGAMDLEPDSYRTDTRLIEVCFGDWEGQTYEELVKTVPGHVDERVRDKWNFQPRGENAESYEILSWRVAAWVNDIASPTVCVTHGGVIRTLFHIVAGVPGAQAADLSVPQDRVLKIEDGALDWLAPPAR